VNRNIDSSKVASSICAEGLVVPVTSLLSMAIGVVVALALALTPTVAGAQSGDASGSDFSLFGGYMLPNQIDNVTEILPLFGGRYGLGLPLGAAEFNFENAHARGIDWTSLGVSLRGDIPVAPGMTGFIYGGPDFHYYVPAGETNRHAETGLHFGAGAAMMVKDSLWVRGDIKFMGNPGTALYLLFGLMFRPAGAM
jgi:hypothetical protein